jgi:hypothetical protein
VSILLVGAAFAALAMPRQRPIAQHSRESLVVSAGPGFCAHHEIERPTTRYSSAIVPGTPHAVDEASSNCAHHPARPSLFGGTTPTHASEATAKTTMCGCPKCGAPLVRRLARRGGWRGQVFYGCTRFPRCRGLVNSS